MKKFQEKKIITEKIYEERIEVKKNFEKKIAMKYFLKENVTHKSMKRKLRGKNVGKNYDVEKNLKNSL